MKPTRYLLQILFIWLGLLELQAQPACTVHSFGQQDGLNTNVISGVEADGNGLLWLATVNGVSFYDGYGFHPLSNFSHRPNAFMANRMLNIIFDSDNNLWGRAADQLIYRYDTHTGKYTEILPAIYGDKVPSIDRTKLYKGRQGYMWLIVWAGGKQSVYRLRNDISDKNGALLVQTAKEDPKEVKHIATDPMGNEWLMRLDSGEMFNDDKPVWYPYNHLFTTAHNTLIYNDSTGAVGRLVASARRVLPLTSLGRIKLNSIDELKDGSVVLGTGNGVVELKVRGSQLLPGRVYFKGVDVENIHADSRGRLWAFTADGRLLMAWGNREGEVKQITQTDFVTTLSDNHIFYEDDNHALWIALKNGPFSYYDEQTGKLIPYKLTTPDTPFASMGTIKHSFKKGDNCLWLSNVHTLLLLTFYQHRYHLTLVEENQEVRAMERDRSGRLWGGTDGGKVAVMAGAGARPVYLAPDGSFTDKPVKLGEKVRAIYCDKQGRMWIGTRGSGIYIYDHGKLSHYEAEHAGLPGELNSGDVYDFMEAGDGRMLVATYGGGLNVASWNKDRLVFDNFSNGRLPYPKKAYTKMRRLVRAHNGVVLMATTDGIVTCDGRIGPKTRFYQTPRIEADTTLLLSSDVMSMLVAKDGTIYVATRSGGLQRITSANLLQDHLKFASIGGLDAEEGVMQSIVEDSNGHIWVVREQSIDRVNSNGAEANFYTTNETGQKLTLSESEPVYDRKTGTLYLGALGGVADVNLAKLTRKGRKPTIVMTNVLFQGERTPQVLLYADKLEVPVSKRSLTLSFAALDYDDNNNIRYAYKLEGVDKDWHYTTYGNSASYNNLPAGTLTFKVRSTDDNGIWLDNTRTLTLHVEPRFVETVWAKMLLIIVLIVAAMGVLRYRDNRRQMQLDRKMNDMRTAFYDQIGHQLRTPLALIGSPVTEVLRTATLKDTERKMLEMVQRNARKMLDLVNRLINYDRADNYLVDDNSAPVFTNVEDNDEESTTEADTKILVVEDNDDLRAFLKSILSATYHVETATNGQEGLEMTAKTSPDFIITDVMMPVMDGMTMVHQLKQNPETSHIPVIILSAKASMSDRLQGLKEGVDDYITKPFSANYLKVRVENILSRRRLLQEDLLAKIDDHQPLPEVDMPQIVDADKEMMEKLMNYIDENIENVNLKVDDMADAVYLGRTVFNQKVKGLVGLTPNRFLMHVRLEKAKALIDTSRFTFAEIAQKVGFSDARYFSKCFKREMGCTPSEYRDLHVKHEA